MVSRKKGDMSALGRDEEIPSGKEFDLAWKILEDDHPLESVADAVTELGCVGESRNAKMLYLSMLSSILPCPFGLEVSGCSASGKSKLINTVAKLFPKHCVFRAGSFVDPNEMDVWGGCDLRNRIVIRDASVTEDDESEGSDLYREMAFNGRMDSGSLQIEGPISYIESVCPNTDALGEKGERMFRLQMNEGRWQTRKVIQRISEDSSWVGSDEHIRRVSGPFKALYLILRRTLLKDDLIVSSPFTGEVKVEEEGRIPTAICIRDMASMVCSAALMNYCHRELYVDEQGIKVLQGHMIDFMEILPLCDDKRPIYGAKK